MHQPMTGTQGLIMIDGIPLFIKHPLATSGVFTVIYGGMLEMPESNVWDQGERTAVRNSQLSFPCLLEGGNRNMH